MRRILFGLTLIFSLFLSSCTSKESAVKKLALAEAEAHFYTSLQKEAEDMIPQSDWLRDAYIEYIKKNSEFNAEEPKFQSDSLAVAVVTVKTYSLSQRRTLGRIAGSMASSKVRQFNFSNALQMIAKQTGTSLVTEKQNAGVFKYHKNSSGDWQLQN